MDDLEDVITEELSRLSPANAETTISSEDTDDLSEEDGEAENSPYAAVIPETFLSRLHMDSRIIDAIENAFISGKHEGESGFYGGVRAPEEVLQETGTWCHEDHLQPRNRIISEMEAEESMTVRSNRLPVTTSKETLTDFPDDDFYREAEKKFSFDLEDLEKRLKEDTEKIIARDKKMKEHILKERREEEDRRRHRYRIFEEELKEIEWETMPQDFGTKEENTLLLDLDKQEAVIAELQKQLEEERQTNEAAQTKERRRAEELRNSAAVKIQASVRAFLVSKRTAAVLSQRRKERMKKHWGKEEIVRQHKEEQKIKEDEKRKLGDKDKFWEREEKIRKQTEEEGRRTREIDECRESEEEIRKETEEEEKRTREKDECGKREEIIVKQTEEEERRVREKDQCRKREKKIRIQTEEEGRRMRENDECRAGEGKIRKHTEEEGRRMREKDKCREREEIDGKQIEEERRREREKDESSEGKEEIRNQTEEEERRTREKDECREKEDIRKQTEEEGRRTRRTEEEVDENQEEKLHVGEQKLWQEDWKRNEEWKENMKREEQINRTMEEKQIGKEKETRTKDRFMVVDFLERQTPKLEESKNKKYEEIQKQDQLERNPRMEKENVRRREIDNRFQENYTKQEIVKRTSQDLAWSINGRHRENSATSGNKTGTWKLPDNQQNRLLHPQCDEEQLDSLSMQRASLFSCVCSVDPCISPENSVNKGPEMTCLHTYGAAMNPSETQGLRGGPVDKSLHHPAPDELLSKDNVRLPDSIERKRVRWMHACTPWSKVTSRGLTGHQREKKVVARRPPNELPLIAVDVLLRAGTCSSLKQVTTVTLEDLPGCSLSTLSECVKLQALTLRRCGLIALEGISRCQDLGHIDVQENSIRFINCQDLVNLRVLLLNRNQLTSIHGLEGASNLAVLELSYNSISRISGLETLTNLQRLLIDHNQLISTRGLRGVSTLLYLDCAHNHLSSLDGIDGCVLLGTLRLQGNNISEPPRLSDHVLIRELHLDDNSLSSLDSVSACWLPLLRRISASRNSITQLPALSDFLSLRSLDVSYNCLSDLANVRLGLRGCPRLQDIHVFKNPFQQEVDWRSALLETLTGLREIDGEQISTSPASATDGKCEVVPGSFTALCQFQAEQLEREQGRLDRGRQ